MLSIPWTRAICMRLRRHPPQLGAALQRATGTNGQTCVGRPQISAPPQVSALSNGTFTMLNRRWTLQPSTHEERPRCAPMLAVCSGFGGSPALTGRLIPHAASAGGSQAQEPATLFSHAHRQDPEHTNCIFNFQPNSDGASESLAAPPISQPRGHDQGRAQEPQSSLRPAHFESTSGGLRPGPPDRGLRPRGAAAPLRVGGGRKRDRPRQVTPRARPPPLPSY